MDCEREREREREKRWQRGGRDGGRERGREGEDAGAAQCSAVGGCHYERHLPHKGNRQGCR